MPVRLTAKQIISVLKDNGFELTGQKGSHQKWHNSNTDATTIVPCHGNNQIAMNYILKKTVARNWLAVHL